MSAFGGAFGHPSNGFGAPSSSAFGAPTTFGQSSASAFGAAASAFGAPPSAGLFGVAASQPSQSGFGAFGQSAAPFGASSVFGASAAQPASAFGAAGSFGGSAFGAQSTPAFGASSVSAFGAPSSQSLFGSAGGAFGAASGSTLFGTARPPPTGGAFGSTTAGFGQSQQAWGGAPSSNAFGAGAAFGASSGGSGLFGNTGAGTSLFGAQQNTGFGGGAQAQGQVGTANTNWQLTIEYDGNPGAASKYQAISMMPAFRDKSLEELRLEDYSVGNKGGPGPTAQGGGLFGQSAPASTGLFGASANGFGAASSAGFGASAPFGAQSQGGGFGASSGGGIFGGSSFGNTSGFGQSSAAGFGAGAGSGAPTGGAFGQSAGGTGFAAQSGNAFGQAAFGASGSAFGAGAFGMGSSGGGFGGGGGFGASSSGFASAGGFGANASGFGAPGFGSAGTAQSAGGNMFAGAGASGAFGAPQSQPSLFGSQPQHGAGLFKPAGAAAGASGFGAFSGQSAGGFGSAPSGSLFAGVGGAASAPSLFDGNAGGQNGFGAGLTQSTGFAAPNPGGGAGLFSNTGSGFGQAAAGAGFGQGAGAFGAQPNLQQAGQSSHFSNLAGTGQVGAGGGFSVPLQNTYAAVTQNGGGTVAPPGANYGTVLHNLQKLQGDLEQHKRQVEQQVRSNADNTKRPGELSIVVLPSPPLVKLTAARLPSAPSPNEWLASTSHRTKMRSTVGRTAGATKRISGTPLQIPPSPAAQPNQETKEAPETAITLKPVPFFSPKQFSGAKRRSQRSSEMSARVTSTPIPLPLLDSPEGVTPANGRTSRAERRHQSRASAENSLRAQAGDTAGSAPARPRHAQGNGVGSSDALADSPGAGDEPYNRSRADTPAGSSRGSYGKGSVSGQRRGSWGTSSGAAFMWSSPRPSTWSRNLPLDSADQYDPEKYLPRLSKKDYYVVPSLADLGSMTMKELQSIEDFTVGRTGFGEVTWIEPVDVRGLNLDEVIEIQRGEVAVYPDREAEQLDAPAVVTLLGMYKKNKKTGSPVTDPESAATYGRKLKAFCDSHDLKFLLYNPSGGRWQFEVPGFSEARD